MRLVLWPASAALVLACALPILSSIGATEAQVEKASAAVHTAVLGRHVEAKQSSAPLPVVIEAVKAARAGRPIPWPVKPSVGKVESDRFTFPNGCLPTPSRSSSAICRFGDVRLIFRLITEKDEPEWVSCIDINHPCVEWLD